MNKTEIGEIIKATRQQQSKSYHRINRNTDLLQSQTEGIEDGTTNYTINSLLKLLDELNLIIKIEDKET